MFGVYMLGGMLIALGPGQLLLSLVPKPDATARHVLEIVVGAAMVVGGALLWRQRERLSERAVPNMGSRRKSGAILGATITAVELPTAFPYFAAIAAIVGSGLDTPRQLLLLLIFNLCFVLPLFGIAVTLWLAGDRAQRILTSGRDFVQNRWPLLLSVLLLLAGVFIIALGATGLSARGHGRFGRFMRHVHVLIHP